MKGLSTSNSNSYSNKQNILLSREAKIFGKMPSGLQIYIKVNLEQSSPDINSSRALVSLLMCSNLSHILFYWRSP